MDVREFGFPATGASESVLPSASGSWILREWMHPGNEIPAKKHNPRGCGIPGFRQTGNPGIRIPGFREPSHLRRVASDVFCRTPHKRVVLLSCITGRPHPHIVIPKGLCQDHFMEDINFTSFRILPKTAGIRHRVGIGSDRVGVG